MLKLRTIGLLAGLTVVAGIIGSNTSRAQAAEEKGPNQNIYFPQTPTQTPVLVYDVTGGTLAGVIHLQLSVYNTGFASISASGFNAFEPPDDGRCPNDGRADYAFVGQQAAKDLLTQLKGAGAFEANNGAQGLDVPLHTVTVFANRGAEAKTHSFTYQFASSPEIFATAEVINQFIDTYFPSY